MNKLTQKQHELLTKIRTELSQEVNAKDATIIHLIDSYNSNNISSNDFKILKNYVQLYALNERKKQLKRQKNQIDYEKKKLENKQIVREKIIFSSVCFAIFSQYYIHTADKIAIYIFAHSKRYLSERDAKFIFEKYGISFDNISTYKDKYNDKYRVQKSQTSENAEEVIRIKNDGTIVPIARFTALKK